MRRRRFQEVSDPQSVRLLADIAQLWGYPRELDESDWHPGAIWFRFGDDVIFWMQKLESGYAVVHTVRDPYSQAPKGAEARRLFHTIEFIGDLIRAKGLLASDCTTTGEVASYLQRLGWVESDERPTPEDVWYVRNL